jgi:hypothetical protein
MNETKNEMQDIRSIENKYGLVLFRMALTHLFDTGWRNFGNEEVEDCIKQITEQGDKDKANGKIPVMTPEFQCGIIRCAADLSRFSIWTLFEYIKKHIVVGAENETGKHDAGVCPACGAEVEYGKGQVDDDDYVYKWKCEECGAYGREYYDMTFSESIIDGEGGE